MAHLKVLLVHRHGNGDAEGKDGGDAVARELQQLKVSPQFTVF